MAGPIEMDTTFEDAGAASSLDGISTGNVFYVFSTDSARILACKWIWWHNMISMKYAPCQITYQGHKRKPS